ncbi:MAG: hypothetical protein AB7V62_02400 [Thermoleophilia bacterium]
MRRVAVIVSAGLALTAAAPAVGATTTVRLDAEPRAAVNAGSHLWVLADRGDTRVLIEAGHLTGRPTGREVVVATGVTRDPEGTGTTTIRPSVTLAGGGVWTVDPATGDAVRVDPARAAVTVRAPIATRVVAAGPAGLWATGPPTAVPGGLRYAVRQLDPATGAIVGEVAFGPGLGGPRELAVGAGGVWVARIGGWLPIVRIDARTGAESLVDVGSWRLSAHGGTLVSTRRAVCLAWVAPWAGPVRPLRMCPPRRTLYPRDLALAGGRVWWAAVAGKGAARRGVLVRRDASGAPGRVQVRVGRDPVDVVPSGRGVWVLSRSDRTLTRVTP